ncbi:MAG TPA: DNA replication and repair protein RecF [Longimicrobiales bacterium]|nr:DNA replication and repair protein RecF [Longimicrobiales bacterium]
MSGSTPSLVCRELRLRQFRNFEELALEIPSPGVAVIGPNGAGKTNLIEAVYYLEVFRSFRGANDEQLVRFGADTFFVRGLFEDPGTGESREITAAYERSTRRKRVTVSGVEPDRIGDALGRIGVVVFSPSDVALVAGAPGERRRFLDIVLSLNRPGYLAALQRYRQVLRQRNALLRDGARPAALEPWSRGLVEAGARVVAERAAWVAGYAAAFAARYAAIGDGGTDMVYRPSAGGGDLSGGVDAVEAVFREELERVAVRERERGMTLVGPHRDDLGFLRQRDGVDLREFGSGGQQRTAAIALRMVEADTIREARKRSPLTLLDDVFAELDPERSRRVLALLDEDEGGQVILTAPKASDVDPRGGALARWRIAGGAVQP